MADDVTADPGSGGATFRALEDGSNIHWPVSVMAEATTIGTPDVLQIRTAAALADGTANPTLLLGSSCILVFNGTTWDRARGDTTTGLFVGGAIAHDSPDSGNPLKIGGKAETTIPTAVADGDRVDAWFSERGALGTFGEPFTVAGSASANDTDLVSVDCARYRSVSFFTDGTFSATITWQVSNDNVTWDTVFAYRADQSTPDLRTSNTSADIWHTVNIPTRYFRIRTSAYTSGTVNVRCHFSAFPYDPPYLVVGGGSDHDETYSNPPIPAGFFASSTQPANVSASGDMVHGWATLDGAQVVKVFGSFTPHDAVDAGNPLKIGGKAETTVPTAVADGDRVDAWFSEYGGQAAFGESFTTSGSGAALDAEPINQDCARYRGVCFTVTGSFTATLAFECSNDGSTWDSLQLARIDTSIMSFASTSGATDVVWAGAVPARHFRIRLSAHSTGTVNVAAIFTANEPPYASNAAVSGDRTHDLTDAGSAPVKIGGRARSTAISAVASDDRVDAIFSTTGGQLIAGSNAGVPTEIGVDGSNHVQCDIAASSATVTVDLGTNNDVQGDVAHDGVDSGNPVKIGAKAVNVGATPTAVAAADRTDALATREGQLLTLAGHPNVVSREFVATSAKTDIDLLGAVAAGNRVVVTEIEVLVDADATVSPKVRIGFGATTVPTEPTDGNSVAGVVLTHPAIAAGSGVVRGNGSAIIAVGGDGEELRITCEAPTGGQITVLVSYFVIAA